RTPALRSAAPNAPLMRVTGPFVTSGRRRHFVTPPDRDRVICRGGVGSQRPSAPRPRGGPDPPQPGARAGEHEATTTTHRIPIVSPHHGRARGLLRYSINICRCENSRRCSRRLTTLAISALLFGRRERVRLARSTPLARRYRISVTVIVNSSLRYRFGNRI